MYRAGVSTQFWRLRAAKTHFEIESGQWLARMQIGSSRARNYKAQDDEP